MGAKPIGSPMWIKYLYSHPGACSNAAYTELIYSSYLKFKVALYLAFRFINYSQIAVSLLSVSITGVFKTEPNKK